MTVPRARGREHTLLELLGEARRTSHQDIHELGGSDRRKVSKRNANGGDDGNDDDGAPDGAIERVLKGS